VFNQISSYCNVETVNIVKLISNSKISMNGIPLFLGLSHLTFYLYLRIRHHDIMMVVVRWMCGIMLRSKEHLMSC